MSDQRTRDKRRVLSLAACMIRGIPGLSCVADDWPKGTPRKVLAAMAEAEEWARRVGIELAEIQKRMP